MSVINRAYQILELLMQYNHKGLSNTEISQTLSLSTSTCHRLLHSLKEINFVWQRPYDQKYFLGDAHLRYADTILESLDDAVTCLPYLEELHKETEETTYYARFNGTSCVTTEICGYINTRISVRRGEILPLHATASGMAVLAFIPEKEKQSIIDNMDFHPYTSRTITNRLKLNKRLKQIRKTGVAINFGELHNGINALATPIFNRDRALGSITIVGIAYDLDKAQLDEYAELFVQASIDITTTLGGEFNDWLRS
ncbi:MAG: IclR family transcriptional regulator [Spirochaetota bacterium]